MSIATLVVVLATLVSSVQDPAPKPDGPCQIVGVFVDEAGAPIEGVRLTVRGSEANTERVKRYGRPQSWQHPATVKTGDDGKFSLSFVPPRAFEFTLNVNAHGFGRMGWRWDELEPGKVLDLGTLTLESEAILVGHIVDAEGNLQTKGWSIWATHYWGTGVDGRTSAIATSTIDPTTGQFRIWGLPHGVLRVSARAGTREISATVTAKKGEETFLELRYTGPDPARRLVVKLRSPFLGVWVEPGTVHATGRDGTRHTLTQVPHNATDWHVPDIEPGDYLVEVRDPRFAPVVQEDVRTGVPATVTLVGSASLRLAVVDGETGEDVADYHLHVAYRDPAMGSNAVRVREPSQPRPPGGSYGGISPGDLSLVVEAEGWPKARANVDGLAPGETRDVQVTLERSVALRGRVVDTRGSPLAGIVVQATHGAYPGHDGLGARESLTSAIVGGQQVFVRIGYRDAATTTAEDGSFVLEGLAPETHAVLAVRGDWNDVWTTVELPRAEPLELTLPDAALAEVRLRLPEGESAERLRLGLRTKESHVRAPFRAIRALHSSDPWTCEGAGVFAARFLPVGVQTFYLMRTTPTEFGTTTDTLLQPEITVTGPDVTELVLDLREAFPVRVSLRTLAPAVEPVGFRTLQIRLRGEAESSAPISHAKRGKDGKDHHTLWRVPGSYRVEVYAPGILWSPPEPVEIARNAPNDFEIDLPLVGREVRVLQADGAPLAKTVVAYWTDSERRVVGTTDEDGKLPVVLLAGTLSIGVPPEPESDPEPAPNPALRGRGLSPSPNVDPAVLAGLTARATAEFGAGEGPLELRFRPD